MTPEPIAHLLNLSSETAAARWVRDAADQLREMNAAEIREAWEELPEAEACEFFDAERYTPDQVEEAAGKDAARAYENWIYFNCK